MSAEFYQNNVGKTQGEIKSLEKQINKNAFLRLGLMIAGAIGIWQLFSFNNIFFVLLAMILLILLFAFLVFRQAKVDRKLQEAKVFLSGLHIPCNVPSWLPIGLLPLEQLASSIHQLLTTPPIPKLMR